MAFQLNDSDQIFLRTLGVDESVDSIYLGQVQVWTSGFSFRTQWKTDNVTGSSDASEPNQVKLPLDKENGNYSFTIRWGDGTTNTITNRVNGVRQNRFVVTDVTTNETQGFDEVVHTYETAGVYEISIVGQIDGWSFQNSGDKNKLLRIYSWGPLEVGNEGGYFHGCSNMIIEAPDVLNLENTTNMLNGFRGCTALTNNEGMQNWDVSNIEDMRFMFAESPSFNEDLSEWITGNVRTTRFMFYQATAFNSNISGWNMTSNENMGYMFYEAENFNQPIGSWNTSTVNDMDFMFYKASSFDQDLSSFDVSSVTEFREFASYSGLSVANYDALFNGWASQILQNDINFAAREVQYSSSGEGARQLIIDTYNWTITDGGLST